MTLSENRLRLMSALEIGLELGAEAAVRAMPVLESTGARLLEESGLMAGLARPSSASAGMAAEAVSKVEAVLSRGGAIGRQVSVANPYLEEYKALDSLRVLREAHPGVPSRYLDDSGLGDLSRTLRRKFAYAIPNEEALQAISQHGPIIEMGAGKGYWASLLREQGTTVEAFDKFPLSAGRNEYHDLGDAAFTEVKKGGTELIRKYPDHTLLLVWPPPNSPMALEALNQYKGKTVLYVGEHYADYIGDLKFQQQLNTRFRLDGEIPLPNFPGYDDALHLYTRIK